MADPRRVVVGRLRRPHGLKGEIAVFPLTHDAEVLFAPKRSVWVADLAGEVVAGPLVIERSRGYHREWLLKFVSGDTREAIEPWRNLFLVVPETELVPPKDGEVWLHELAGFAVKRPDGTPLGVVTDVYELPQGVVIEVQGPKREFLLPFRKEFVTEVHRNERRMTVTPPDGLIDEPE